MSEIIRVEHLVKKFGDHEVLKDVHFSVNEGEVVSIIGASGSGKSTLLRTINLFEEPTAGKVYFKGEDLTRPDVNVNMLRKRKANFRYIIIIIVNSQSNNYRKSFRFIT